MNYIDRSQLEEILKRKIFSTPYRLSFRITGLVEKEYQEFYDKMIFYSYHVRCNNSNNGCSIEFANPRKFSINQDVEATFEANTVLLFSIKANEPFINNLFGQVFLTHKEIQNMTKKKEDVCILPFNPTCHGMFTCKLLNNDESEKKNNIMTVAGKHDIRKAMKINNTVRKCQHKFKKPPKDRGRRCAVCFQVNDEGIYSCSECKLAVHGGCMHGVVTNCMASFGASNAGTFIEATGGKDDRSAIWNSPHFFTESKRKAFSSKVVCAHCSLSIGTGKYNVCEACQQNFHIKCSKLAANVCGISVDLIEALLQKPVESKSIAEEVAKPQSPKVNIIMQINNFRFIEIIGEGSFGKVYSAVFVPERTMLAIKQLSMIIKEDDDLVCLNNEMETMKKVSGFPFIVSLEGIFMDKGFIFIVMAMCSNGNLFEYIQKYGSPNNDKIIIAIAQITSAIDFMHSNNLIHRDIKTENVMISSTGTTQLCDFGLSKRLSEDSKCYTFCGTLPYMAPELLNGKSYTFGVDWWALGILTYEVCFNLNMPFEETEKDIMNKVKSNKKLRLPLFEKKQDATDDLQRNLHKFVESLLEKNESKRLGTTINDNNNKNDNSIIKNHEVFKSIDWKTLKTQKGPFDYNQNNDPKVLAKKCVNRRSLRIRTQKVQIAEKDAKIFKKFNYCSPKYMSLNN